MSFLGTSSLNERGLSDCHPMTIDELAELARRPDWGPPREEPGAELRAAAEAAVARTKQLIAEFDPHA